MEPSTTRLRFGRTAFSAMAVVAFLGAAACDGGGGNGGDTTPPAAPDRSRILVSVPNADGLSFVTGEAGAVEANARVRITNVDRADGPPAVTTVSANAEGVFQASIPADIGDSLEIVAIDAAGNESPATTVNAGPVPSSLELRTVGDDPQTGVAGQTLPDPLQVKVTAPPPHSEVAGVAIVFEVLSGGGQLEQARVITDSKGIAAVDYTLGPDVGLNEIAARLEILPEKQIVLTANAVGPPRIDAVEPAQAMPGDTVVIRGANFSPVARHNEVRFGNERGTVVQATSTRLEVEVPPFAVGGPVTVTLTEVPSNGVAYNVLPPVVEAPPVGDTELVTLQNGQGRVVLAFEDASTEYTLVVESVKPTSQSFTTQIRGVGVAFAARGVLAPAAEGAPVPGESLIRQMEREAVRGLPRPAPGARYGALAPAQEVGSQRQFFVVNKAGPISITDAANFDRVTATLRFKGDNTLLYVDDRTPPQNLTDAVIQQVGNRFDDQIFPTDVAAFGTTSDVDGNSRVIILLSPTVNSLTTPDIFAGGSRIVGFFFGIDLFEVNSQNPHSNDAEIFYAVVPDPDATFGAARVTLEEIAGLLSGVFAHELEHMISFNHHVLIAGGQPEALWLDEGLAHMAETLNDLHLQNALRSAFFLHKPENTTLVGGGDALDERGAAWLFVHYVVDRFGEGILRTLVAGAGRLTGISNVDRATDVAFNFFFHEWASMLLVDGPTIPNDPRFESAVEIREDFEEAKELLNRSAANRGEPPRITGEFLDIDTADLPGAAVTVVQRGTSPAYVRVTARGRANAPVDLAGPADAELQVTVIRTK